MTAHADSIKLAIVAAQAADEKLADDIVVIDVSEQLVITDCFVLASGTNERQVDAIVDEVEDKLREAGAKPVRREGTRENRWVLLDYGTVVIHVQRTEEREFYALDNLWADCPVIEVEGIEGAGTRGEGDAVDPFSVTSQDDLPLAGEGPSTDDF
ncbi:ribosome silencing factor [Corynebacterium ulceribovis]|uniref:ribosome silencing factor n=1 Tax=Corynebacterium ulceribovis TaxID=487732 RepID=UPI00036D1CD7|nr:ribosome silencing factor [Corynebacterium ulceribovis]